MECLEFQSVPIASCSHLTPLQWVWLCLLYPPPAGIYTLCKVLPGWTISPQINQTLNHLHSPTLLLLLHVHVSFVLASPEMNTAFCSNIEIPSNPSHSKDNLAQIPCQQWGHLTLDQAAQSPIPSHLAFNASKDTGLAYTWNVCCWS